MNKKEKQEMKILKEEAIVLKDRIKGLEFVLIENKKPKLPTKFEDLCDGRNGYYISEYSEIKEDNYAYDGGDKNLLPTLFLAEAMLAMSQLLSYVHDWNDGWVADWSDGSTKYCIINHQGVVIMDLTITSHPIAFKTVELRDKFFCTFQKELEIALPLL